MSTLLDKTRELTDAILRRSEMIEKGWPTAKINAQDIDIELLALEISIKMDLEHPRTTSLPPLALPPAGQTS